MTERSTSDGSAVTEGFLVVRWTEIEDVVGLFSARPGGRLLGWDDRQQDVRLAASAEMQRRRAVEDLRRPIAGIVVQERAASGQLVLEVGEPSAARPVIHIVLAADREPDPIAGG